MSGALIIGAGLAGLRTAEALCDEGYGGAIEIVGDEAHAPYDRPPLSKQVLSGWIDAAQTDLPRLRPLDAAWRLGRAAVGLDLAARRVTLDDGAQLSFDALVIATGAAARAWPIAPQREGLYTLRTREDAAALSARLKTRPKKVVVIGAGFTGSEAASACRDLGLDVAVIEQGRGPMAHALGDALADYFAALQRAKGVDLRCGVSVSEIEGEERVRGVRLSDGAFIASDCVIACLGAERRTAWLAEAGLDAVRGVRCDGAGRVFRSDGALAAGVFAVGDVARYAHPMGDGGESVFEHWENAVSQARVVADNIAHADRAPRLIETLPAFWSMQFGVSIKSIGFPARADSSAVIQGAAARRRFVRGFGLNGRLIGAVAVNHAQWTPFYEEQIAARAAFPPDWRIVDQPADSAEA